ncbi:DNA internalization-related competence protein ComEC/Rec2 [Mangrovimicrobium sediminis]|nr:DNA internalization-related competence protein ComEC/Rec2 [Haliea sp. SAOS-164]
MLGWLAGTVLLALLPRLPGAATQVLLVAAGLVLLLAGRAGASRYRLLGRLGCGHAWLAAGALLCALGSGAWRAADYLAGQLPPACNTEEIVLRGRVASLPRRSSFADGVKRQRFEFDVAQLTPDECSGPRRVLLSYYGTHELVPGEDWRFTTRLRHPWGLANPGSFNARGWYAASGVHATGSVRGEDERLAPAGAGIGPLRAQLAAAMAGAGLTAAPAAMLPALTVGDRSGLDHHLWRLLQAFGVNHLLVISGLHVAMVAGLGLLLGRALAALLACGGSRRWQRAVPACCAMLGAVSYAALAGFSLPTVRALCMVACLLFATLLARRSGAGHSLLLAACLLLLLDPLALLGSGFWLSCGAVAALLWQDRWRSAGASPLGRSARAHLYMNLAVLPTGAWLFGGSSWVAAAANLLLVPLVGVWIVPLALAGCAVWWVAQPLAAALWRLAGWPLDLLTSAAAGVDTSPFFLDLPGRLLPVFCALAAAVLWPLPWRAVARLMVLSLLLPLTIPPSVPPQPQLTLLDVGQGTAVVFSAGGRTLLYDTGGGNPAGPSLAHSVVLPWLRQRGVRALDELVVSHADLDHSGGVADILAALPVARFRAGVGVRANREPAPCRAGQAWAWPGDVQFQFLWPPAGARRGNDSSCVLAINASGLRILLAGDVSQAAEREMIRYWGDALAADVLLVGHHGSATSTSQAWLNHVRPRIALVGAGYASRFGHPHPVVIGRLQGQGVEVRQSAQEGALTLQVTPAGTLRVEGFRARLETWWK